MQAPAYNDLVAGHFHRPARPLPDSAGNAQMISGAAGSEQAGARVSFFARVQDGLLADVGFRARACPHIIAACSLVSERLNACPPGDLLDSELTGGLQELEIPVEKMGKILILQDALRACWDDFQARHGSRVSA